MWIARFDRSNAMNNHFKNLRSAARISAPEVF